MEKLNFTHYNKMNEIDAREIDHVHDEFVFDHVSFGYDEETILIQDALKTLMKERTSFVIAHRLNTIQEADIMLESGQIIEQGSNQTLMNIKGSYFNLYKGQLKEAANE